MCRHTILTPVRAPGDTHYRRMRYRTRAGPKAQLFIPATRKVFSETFARGSPYWYRRMRYVHPRESANPSLLSRRILCDMDASTTRHCLAAELRRRRLANGLTQARLAQAAGVSRSLVVRAEKADPAIDPDRYAELFWHADTELADAEPPSASA